MQLADMARRPNGAVVDLDELLRRCDELGVGHEFRAELARINRSNKSTTDKQRSRDRLRHQVRRFLDNESRTQATMEASAAGSPAGHAAMSMPAAPVPEPLPSPTPPAPLDPVAQAAAGQLMQPNGTAILQNLTKYPELNGTDVVLLQYFADRGRWGVRCVDGRKISVRVSLLHAPAAVATAPPCSPADPLACDVQVKPESLISVTPLPTVDTEEEDDDDEEDDDEEDEHLREAKLTEKNCEADGGDDIDEDAVDAHVSSMLQSMGMRHNELTRQHCWAAAHENTDCTWHCTTSRLHADGEPMTWDDIPEDEKDWRHFV